MGRQMTSTPSRNTLAKRRSRMKAQARANGQELDDYTSTMADERCDEQGSTSITPPNLSSLASGDTESTLELEREQALWVRRRREITELELAKRMGELVPAAEAKARAAALGARIRTALNRIPNALPAHLSQEHRTICESAIKTAVAAALNEL